MASTSPNSAPAAIVVVGQGVLAETLAATLAGLQTQGGAPVIHLLTPAPPDAPAEPFPCPIRELDNLPARADYPIGAPEQRSGQPETLTRQGEGFIITLTDGSTILASQVVIASSRAAGKLLPPLGLNLPLRPARAHRLEFMGVMLASPLSENLGYGTVLAYPEPTGTTLVYDGLADPSQATFEATADARIVTALEQWLAPQLTSLTDAGLPPPVITPLRLATTPDYLPAVGPWPGMPGLWLAVGLACWGPGLAHGLAALFATTFRGQHWPANLAFVGPARFRDGEAAPVTRPQWLVERQPIVIGPQFATIVRMTGSSRATRPSADADIQLTGSTVSDVANTVNFKQGKTVQRAGDGDATVGRPLVEKGKARAAPVRSK